MSHPESEPAAAFEPRRPAVLAAAVFLAAALTLCWPMLAGRWLLGDDQYVAGYGFRLFGAEMGGSQSLIFGISHFLPGGGAGPDASPPEKIYFILDGELTVIVDGRETVAKRGDSVYIGPNESREIVNRSNEVCTIAVAVAPVK